MSHPLGARFARSALLVLLALAACSPASSAPAPVSGPVIPAPLGSATPSAVASTASADAGPPIAAAVGDGGAADVAKLVPCGDAPRPSEAAMKPDPASAGPVRLARSADGSVFATVVAHGTFAIPSKTANSSSSHTQVASTWAFAERAGRFVTVGEVARAHGRLAVGRGAPVLTGPDGAFVACRPGGRVALPASPHARSANLVAHGISGTMLTAIYVEQAPRGPLCRGLASGSTARRIHVDRLDVAAATPTWTTAATRDVAPPTGAACRSTHVAAAVSGPDRAAVALITCQTIDGGDYVGAAKCSLQAESWSQGRWTSAAMPRAHSGYFDAIIAFDDVVRVAAEEDDRQHFRVYRAAGASLVAEGDVIEGNPIALFGDRALSADPKGTRIGSNGAGYRFIVHELRGSAWATATDPLEVTSARGAGVLWDQDGLVLGVADEEGRRAVARVVRVDGRGWRDLASLDAIATPP